jgi:hypothetical protein
MKRLIIANILAAGLLIPAAGFAQVSVVDGIAEENGDFQRDVTDVIYLMQYLFFGGTGPVPLAYCAGQVPDVENGDANADDLVDVIRHTAIAYDGVTVEREHREIADGKGLACLSLGIGEDGAHELMLVAILGAALRITEVLDSDDRDPGFLALPRDAREAG